MPGIQREILIAGSLAVALSLLVMALRPVECVSARNLLLVIVLLALAQITNMIAAHVNAAGISHVLADLEIRPAQQKALVDQPEPEKRRADIVARICDFFGLGVELSAN